MSVDCETLRELISYDAETGEFTHLPRGRKWFETDCEWKGWNTKYSGKCCGTVQTKGNGYRRVKITIFGRQYLAHRIAWVLMTGHDAPLQIDHRDRDATNNRWDNLADGSNCNQRNKSLQRNNKSGVAGVYWSKQSGKWAGRVWCMENGEKKYKHLGVFSDKYDAISAVQDFRAKNGYASGHGILPPPYEVDCRL